MEKQILLRPQGSEKSQPFSPEHAERLLAYPGTLWSKVENEAKAPEAGDAKPTVTKSK